MASEKWYRYDVPRDELPACHRTVEDEMDTSTCGEYNEPWFCTKVAGHDGDHVAHDSRDNAIARWPR